MTHHQRLATLRARLAEHFAWIRDFTERAGEAGCDDTPETEGERA